jgi:hypothetical protein
MGRRNTNSKSRAADSRLESWSAYEGRLERREAPEDGWQNGADSIVLTIRFCSILRARKELYGEPQVRKTTEALAVGPA